MSISVASGPFGFPGSFTPPPAHDWNTQVKAPCDLPWARPPASPWGSSSPSRPPRRILLTSSGLTKPLFGQALQSLLQSRCGPGASPKVLYISDAIIGNGCDAGKAYQAVVSKLAELGVTRVARAELRQTTPEALALLLQGVDCVYCDMGNTYYLRYHMRRSGFDHLVPPLVRDAGLVYVGVSAGGMCAGRTISIAFWKGWDNPGYGQEWDLSRIGYDGLNLLPGGQSVFPHYGPQWRDLVQARSLELSHGLLALDEDHAYLVDGIREEVISGNCEMAPSSAPSVLARSPTFTDVQLPRVSNPPAADRASAAENFLFPAALHALPALVPAW